jgi:hypothetical protein
MCNMGALLMTRSVQQLVTVGLDVSLVHVQTSSGGHSASYEYWQLFRPRSKADHSPATSAKVKQTHPLPHTPSWCNA